MMIYNGNKKWILSYGLNKQETKEDIKIIKKLIKKWFKNHNYSEENKIGYNNEIHEVFSKKYPEKVIVYEKESK